jgi:thiamine pyrophosphokinase
MNRCVIIGSSTENSDGDFTEFIGENSFVICADGGLDTAARRGIRPSLIIGDFDSLRGPLPEQVETIRLKIEKDDTDMMAAIRVALQRGFRDFVLLGALGGRIDHSFANFCALQYLADRGCNACMAGRDCRVFLRSGGILELNGLNGKTVSVFPFGVPSCTVTYRGMKYPLNEYRLVSGYPLGVSNRIANDKAEIEVQDGNALIMLMTE